MTENPADKRRFKRVPDSFLIMYRVRFPFTVHVRIGMKECDAVATDVGEEGIGFLTNYDIPANSLLNLQFNILNETAPFRELGSRAFELDGEVRYVLLSSYGYQLGIHFMKIGQRDRDFIARYVETKIGQD